MRTESSAVRACRLLAGGVFGVVLILVSAGGAATETDSPRARGVLTTRSATLRRGVSKASERTLQLAADRAEHEWLRKDIEEEKRSSQAVRKVLAPERRALESALKKQPGYAAFQNRLLTTRAAVMKAITKARTDKEKRKAMRKACADLGNLLAQNRAMLQAAHKAAKIDKKKVARNLKRTKQSAGPIILEMLSFVIFPVVEPEEEEPQPSSIALTLTPAYGEGRTFKKREGLGVAAAFNAPGTGWVRASADGGAAFSTSKGCSTVGDYVTVPPGYTLIRIIAEIETKYELMVSVFPGNAKATAHVYLACTDASGETWRKKKRVKGLEASWFWYARQEETKTVTVTRTIAIAPTGGEFLIRAGTRSYEETGGNGLAFSLQNATVKKITVELYR